MQNLVKIICVLLLNSAVAFAQSGEGSNIEVRVTNLNSNDGKVFVALYDSEGSFLNKGIKSIKTSVDDKTCKVVFENIPDGIYAVSLFHDENNNGKMDTGAFGIPKEDYGCSNNAKGFMGPPKWEDAKFQIKGESKKFQIEL